VATPSNLDSYPNKPGGNVTGVTFMNLEFGAKRLELLHRLVPNAVRIAMLVDPNYPLPLAEMRDVQTAALTLGLQIDVLNASTESQMDAAFATMVEQGAGALLVGANILYSSTVTDSFGWRRAMRFPRSTGRVSSSTLVA
jgi:putative tryptophan/tyrosine transport system substrate-binding protein